MRDTFGAIATKEGVEFTVWAPSAEHVDVIVHDSTLREIRMRPGEHGVHRALVADLRPGVEYQFQIGDQRCPDPYSCFQPKGPHGPSLIVDRGAHRWRDRDWTGIKIKGQVVYELHVGTFTEQGTFDAAIEQLQWLRSMGVTLIEVMPIAEFPGRFNWGYDGVNLFAPFHGYGDYDSLKRFVDAAHDVGLAVILDVVYNHIGPSGNYLSNFSPHYFTHHIKNDWGSPYNADGPHNKFVRQFLIDNACYWVQEFHLDGLRLDATTNIPDTSPKHILAELTETVRAAVAPKSIVFVAEDEQQQATRLLPIDAGGFDFDAMWNDDFHHSAQVALRGRRHAYLNDYRGSAQEFVSAAKYGFLFQGQYYFWQRQPRGERASNTRAPNYVTFLDNHDQIANSLYGLRSHQTTSAAKYRALTALFLLGPQTPMLFMGQEFGAQTPFHYFADHDDELNEAVNKGRKEFLEQFPGYGTPEALDKVPNASAEETFKRSKLCWREEARDPALVRLHRDLLKLRREDPVLSRQDATQMDGAVLTDSSFVLRWFDEEHGDRLLVVNLATDFQLEPAPEPLIAPSPRCFWSLAWSSARVTYGGGGIESPEVEHGWRVPGECAVLLIERSILSAKHDH